MKIIINGQTKEFPVGITVEQALAELELSGKVMACAINMEIVKQNDWESYRLKDSDKLELLDFVGGG